MAVLGKLRCSKSDADECLLWAEVCNQGQCALMQFWLAEALGLPEQQSAIAFVAITGARPRGASQCGALRKVNSWEDIEAVLAKRKLGPLAQMKAVLG